MTEQLVLDGRAVPLSTLDRVLFPRIGFTKRDLLGYYLHVADVLLPHLADRPATLHRFPTGIGGRDFFQTRCPPHPSWIRTQRMHVFGSGKDVESVVVDDLAALAWAVNLSTVEFHPYLAHAGRLDVPTALVLDLDPGRPAGPLDAAWLALAIREELDAHGLVGFAKVSGSKGVHVHVPLSAGQGYDATKAFARALAHELTKRWPERVTDVMATRARAGKVFVDWSQNDAGKSTVAPYSLRGWSVPTVAAPVTWEEIEQAVAADDARRLIVTFAEALERLDRIGDPLASMADVRQALPH